MAGNSSRSVGLPAGVGQGEPLRLPSSRAEVHDQHAVAGGGDTVAALNHSGVAGDFTFVSTAGGAFLEPAACRFGIAGNAEALRVVNAMPKWEPARVNGVAVPMDYLLPVMFALEEQH